MATFSGAAARASGGEAPSPAQQLGEWPARDGATARFDGALHELVAIGLYRPALDALCSGASAVARPPVDQAYLLKILEEEVGRQFGHPLRPMIELVLNAVDASRGAGAAVDVMASPGRVDVIDQGEGMGLRSILSRLLVPFATDKRPGLDIGRFGVGFFSVIGLGIPHPHGFVLDVATGDGTQGWIIRVVAEGPSVSALRSTVWPAPPMRGTHVSVTSALIDAEAVRVYLRDTLHFFPPDRALIRVNGVAVNDGRFIAGGREYEDVAGPGDPPLAGRFHIGGRGLAAGITAATYHAGVKIDACLAVAELVLIDFPAAVEVTEGRDALKLGPEYQAVATAFHRRLMQIGAAAGADSAAGDRLAELSAQISVLMLRSASWDQMAKEIARVLLGPDRYLVTPERKEALLGFLGPEVAHRLFAPESFWAEREWQAFLPGERELLGREIIMDRIESLAGACRRRRDLRGLSMLAARAPEPDAIAVALCRARGKAALVSQCDAAAAIDGPSSEHEPAQSSARPRMEMFGGGCLREPPAGEPLSSGVLPCLGTRQAVLIRDDARAVRSPRGWADVYALKMAFDRASGLREADVERGLIVAEPLGQGGHS